MPVPVTFAAPHAYLGARPDDRGAAFCIAGVPLDIGTTNRAGTRDGPRAIRAAARMLTDGRHPDSGVDPTALDLSDLGEFEIALGDIPESLRLIEQQAAGLNHLLAFGGEHGVTLPLLRALTKRLGGPVGLVHIDAHLDTSEDNFGQRFAHGSVFWHAITEGLIAPKRMIQVGIRAPAWPEMYDWTRGQGVTIVPAQEVHESTPAAVAARIREVVGEGPAYLSFDIDGLDPAFAPGTGTPEIGGLATWQAQGILRRLGGIDFRGADVVEVAPAYDVAEITALAAATIGWEYLCLQAARA
ncbi:agmatinase [Neoroseomonas oryzicola]|uniref:Agmatinase n=1 Tax=Neoroseomonas oryzicola TaxID=535904 RepID=A0A9X9WD95_9PROT|nr:agmatinase [Neoroseomonas oryzicola]MBR0658305.1 agmatinase [Neoroseomonas oryzicola]NKE18470.1 agmatinase [Neoroseomonas oryzicola]